MNNIIQTQSVSKNFLKAGSILLEQKPRTALVFLPEIHANGIRGHLIRFRKNASNEWERINEDNFNKMNFLEGRYIELSTDVLSKLLQEYNKLKAVQENGIEYGSKKYFVSENENSIEITNINKKDAIKQILQLDDTHEFWDIFCKDKPALADQICDGHFLMKRRQVINELEHRLNQTYSETSGDDSWQKWIYQHNWVFGVNYRQPIEKQKINLAGIMPDYLFPTVDNFIDILEIKLPEANVIEEDKSHRGSWSWSKETNLAIGQVVNYLTEMDRLRFEIEHNLLKSHNIQISLIKPRASILIGKDNDWSSAKKEALRKLNHALHGIEILTYTDLLKRAKCFVET